MFNIAGMFRVLKVRLVSAARRQLDPVDQMITDAKWDSIRTTIKTAPLAEIKVGNAMRT